MRLMPVLCFCALAVPASAQFNGMSASADRTSATITINMAPGMVTVPCVTGAPYSGTRTIQSVQTLADGTHITQPVRTQETTRRDSSGRVRIENQLFGGRAGAATQGTFVLVKVQDPAAGYAYVIDSVNQVAHRAAIRSRSSGKPSFTPRQAGSHTSPDGTTTVTEPR